MELKEEYFPAIQQAGFRHVRIPIKWSAHAKTEPPYTVDRKFFGRIDWAIEQALSRGLMAIINTHHYDEIVKDPDQHEARLVGLWKQIAERYKDRADYLERVRVEAEALAEQRYLLAEDVPVAVEQAAARYDAYAGS